jgi:hypothetical protein
LFPTNAFLAAHSQAVFLLQAIEWLALNATDRKDAGGSAIPSSRWYRGPATLKLLQYGPLCFTCDCFAQFVHDRLRCNKM